MLLNTILDRMESINLRIDQAVHAPGKDLQVLILGLRHDFASQCGDFLKALGEDPRTLGDRALFEQLQDQLDNMRVTFATHQRKWQTVDIRQDYRTYRSASRGMYEAVASFTRSARATLEGYSPTGHEIGLQMLRILPAHRAASEEQEAMNVEPPRPDWDMPSGPRRPFE